MRETRITARYIDKDGKITGRRNAVGTAYTFERTHRDGHTYDVTLTTKIGIKPPTPIKVMASMQLDEYLYDYDTRGDHKFCKHPWRDIKFDNEEYGGSTCGICSHRFQNNGRP